MKMLCNNHIDCDPWFCATYRSAIFPFASLNNNCLLSAIPMKNLTKTKNK